MQNKNKTNLSYILLSFFHIQSNFTQAAKILQNPRLHGCTFFQVCKILKTSFFQHYLDTSPPYNATHIYNQKIFFKEFLFGLSNG